MYSIAQIERDLKSLPWLILVVLGASFWALLCVPAGEEALPNSVMQSVVAISFFLCVAAILVRRQNVWLKRLGLLPILLGFLTALIEISYYLTGEFEKGNNLFDYLSGGNPGIAGEFVAYAPYLAVLIVVAFFLSVMKGNPPKRA